MIEPYMVVRTTVVVVAFILQARTLYNGPSDGDGPIPQVAGPDDGEGGLPSG